MTKTMTKSKQAGELIPLFKSKPCDDCGKHMYTKPPYHAIYDGVRDMGDGKFRCWPCNRLKYLR